MKKWIHNIILLVAVIVFVVSGSVLTYHIYQEYKEEKRYDELREEVSSDKLQFEFKDEPQLSEEEKRQLVVNNRLDSYARLYEENSDIYGWIRIEDTNVNYPVMYTPNNSEFYLRRNFDKEYAFGGTPFVEPRSINDEYLGNVIIYGHNGPGDTMFADVSNYSSSDYWKEHKIIEFDTLNKVQRYEVLAFFSSQVYEVDDQVFKYYHHYTLPDEQSFDYYVRNVKQLAAYETGVSAEFGDELITLSTCNYSREDGRYVLVAKKISEEIKKD